jgi:hypothetical protein
MAVPSRTLPSCFGPAGVASAPIPMEERSLDVAESDAVRTAGFNTECNSDDDDDDLFIGIAGLNGEFTVAVGDILVLRSAAGCDDE